MDRKKYSFTLNGKQVAFFDDSGCLYCMFCDDFCGADTLIDAVWETERHLFMKHEMEGEVSWSEVV